MSKTVHYDSKWIMQRMLNYSTISTRAVTHQDNAVNAGMTAAVTLGRKYKHYCLYCEKGFNKLSNHLRNDKHQEELVQKIKERNFFNR